MRWSYTFAFETRHDEQTSFDLKEGIKRMRASFDVDASGASSSSLINSKQNNVRNALKLTSNWFVYLLALATNMAVLAFSFYS